MAALTLRLVKGTPLTNAELDANFSNLNADVAARLLASSNLADLTNAGTARTNLGLGNVENKSSATIRSEITSGNVTTALGFTPYNASNPSGYITSSALTPYLTSAAASSTYQPLDTDLTAIAGLAGTTGVLRKTAANTWALDTATYLTGNQSITVSGDAAGSGTTAISLTLANSGVTAGTYTKVTVDAKGRVTTGASLASADLPTYTGTLISSQVTTALGFTPYNSTNPSGYITSAALSSYLPLTGGTLTSNLLINSGTDSRLLVQVSGITEGQLQATSTTVRLATNNTLPLALSTSGVDRVTLASNGQITFASSTFLGLGGAPSTSARLRVFGTGTSSEVARFEGGTLASLLLINQTDDPGVNSNRSGISFRKNNVEGGAISVDYNGTRGIVYYDASGASGSHAFYVNGSDRMRLNQYGGLSFSGAGYGTAGQALLSGGSAAPIAWGDVVTPTGTQTLTNKTATALTLNGGYTEQVSSLNNTTWTSITLAGGLGSIQVISLYGPGSPSNGLSNGQSVTLLINALGNSITWPAITWQTSGGSAPTLKASGVTVIHVWMADGVVYGAPVGVA